jgi:hypothetical protein
VQSYEWTLRELAVVSPFSFPIYASKIKENMMLEDPAAALERIYFEMYSRVEQLASSPNPAPAPAPNPEFGSVTEEIRSRNRSKSMKGSRP